LPKNIEALQSEVQRILGRYKVPGAGIALVFRDGRTWSSGVGMADVAAMRPVTSETVFRGGSVSKTLVAMALLKLQEEGQVSLDDPVRDIVPELAMANPWEQSDPVRIVHLLEHTSGLEDMRPAEMYNFEDPPDIPLRQVLLRFPKPARVRWRPGTRFAYSNPGYGLVGYIIERFSRQRFEDYIRQELFEPTGMLNSDFRLSDRTRPFLAQGYDSHGEPVGYRNIYLRPAGDLKSSPADMGRLMRMLLNRGAIDKKEVLLPRSIARMEEVKTTDAARAGLKRGYGLGLLASMRAGCVWYGHDGGIAGFISTFQYSPSEGVGFVVLLNRGSVTALNELKVLLFEFLTAGRPTPPSPMYGLSQAQLTTLAGYYEKKNPRSQQLRILDVLVGGKRVLVKDGHLEIGPLVGKKQVFMPVSQNQFRREGEPEASIVFFEGANGEHRLADASFYGERIPVWRSWTRFVLLTGALGFLVLFVILAVIWIPLRILRKKASFQASAPLSAALLASVLIIAVPVLVGRASSDFETVGTRNVITVGLFFVSWLSPVWSALAFAIALWYLVRAKPMTMRVLTAIAATACFGLTLYFVSWGAFGFKLF